MSVAEPTLAERLPARVDATAQLLLLLAREALTADQRERAASLVRGIEDWQELTAFAKANKSLPFVFKHFSAMPKALFPDDLLPAMHAAVRRMAMSQLALLASMRQFHATCVAPLRAEYVYIKGPALAGLYYEQPVLRHCSDVDILVHPRDFGRVAQAAVQRGDRFVFPTEPPSFATDPADIDFMIRHSDVIMSLDASGTLFELHRHIEKTTPIFSEVELIRSAQMAPQGGARIATLSTAWQFIYICYHHSRHYWSRLHWVADLHALQAHHSFDRSEVIALAQSIGLTRTVEAAMEFASLTDKPELWGSALGTTPAGAFLDACLRGLPGDSAFEIEEWKDSFLLDFANPWQVEPRRKHLLWIRSALRRMQPNCHQYAQKRRPKSLEWLYSVENFTVLTGNALKRVGLS